MSAQMSEKKIRLNALPMRTYNWMKSNAAEADLSVFQNIQTQIDFQIETTHKTCNEEENGIRKETVILPDGVEYSKNAPASVIEEIFGDRMNTLAALDAAGIPANGDCLIQHTGQRIPTGMGHSVDELMAAHTVPVQVYRIADDLDIKENLEINIHPAADQTLVRQVIHVGKNAHVCVLIDCYSPRKTSGFLGVQTYILAEEGADVCVCQVQMMGEDFVVLDDLGGFQEKNSQVKLVRTDLGSKTLYAGVVMNEAGENADFDFASAYLCRNNQRFDYNHAVTERAANTSSHMRFNGVLLDKAEKILRYTIDFRKGAVSAEGEEAEDVLLLSEDSTNRTIPIILCQEEDIAGHHGATIGQMPENTLFYMESRGFTEEDAKKFIIRAKLLAVVHGMPHCLLRRRVETYLRDTL